jgi:hypothetical protein
MSSPSPAVAIGSAGEAPPPVAAPPHVSGGYRRQNDPPSGLLTAGDHDDLLNPLLYARYAYRAMRDLGQQVANLPRVDTRQTLTVEVRDASGRPAAFVPVRVGCADGNAIELSTLADGKVVLFPALDRLGQRVTVSVPGARREVVIGEGAGGQVQTLVATGPARPVRSMDLMIALDATGSMGDEIAFLRSELQAILQQLRRDHRGLDLRIGVVAYRDIGDDYVTWTLPLGSNFDATQARLGQVEANGGGDMPEAMDEALIRAVGQDWRPGAVRSLLLVADAPPHDHKQGLAFAAVEAARARRVQIVPVASSGVDDRAEYFMRAAAALTQSRYVFLTDDSGIGNPHAEPAVDCYVVTSLASAIRRVLASQIGGVRIEPTPGEVVRTSGRYDNGRCVLPPDFQVQ